MLGSEQKKSLRLLADEAKAETENTYYLLIFIHPYQNIPNEHGGGAGHPITAEVFYTGNKKSKPAQLIAISSNADNGIQKGKEIGRYLCDELGLSREIVKLKERQ